ncbi:MAG: hypothetical protein LBH59_03500 [Planctomycetaceae bacterium]|nr:hypothetical protein [Planctomycetaceae bacterium]
MNADEFIKLTIIYLAHTRNNRYNQLIPLSTSYTFLKNNTEAGMGGRLRYIAKKIKQYIIIKSTINWFKLFC